MKNLFFHLMPYKGLPADFDKRYESVWVNIDARLYNPDLVGRSIHEYLDQMRFADELGFDGVCVNEHHSNGYAIMSSPQMMATVLARETKRAAILMMGPSIALYDPPMRVAEDIGTVDAMSGGRVIAGFPIGTPFDTVYAYGQNPASVRQKYLTLNCGNMMNLLQFGNLSHEVGLYNIELFGRCVKPQLDGLFANEWEHHWWPDACSQVHAPAPGSRPAMPVQRSTAYANA